MGEIDIKRQAPNVAYENARAEVRPHFQDPNNKRCDNETIRDWINNPVDTITSSVL
jgi:tryptophan synthase beta subunit